MELLNGVCSFLQGIVSFLSLNVALIFSIMIALGTLLLNYNINVTQQNYINKKRVFTNFFESISRLSNTNRAIMAKVDLFKYYEDKSNILSDVIEAYKEERDSTISYETVKMEIILYVSGELRNKIDSFDVYAYTDGLLTEYEKDEEKQKLYRLNKDILLEILNLMRDDLKIK